MSTKKPENTPEERRPEDTAREPDGSPTKDTADNRTDKLADFEEEETPAARRVTEQVASTAERREANAALDPKPRHSAAHESVDEKNLVSGRFRETTYPMKDVTGPDLADGTPRMPVRKIDRERVRPDPSLFIETAVQITQEGQNDTRDGNIPYVELPELKTRARRLGIEFAENIGVVALRQKLKTWSEERHAQAATRATDDPFAEAAMKPFGDADYSDPEEARRHKGVQRDTEAGTA